MSPRTHVPGELPVDGVSLARDVAACEVCGELELLEPGSDLCARCEAVSEAAVLDGRNRLRACEIAGVTPRVEFWAGEGSPTEWVVSQNLHRRHLDASQRAMVAAGLVPLFAEEAKERQRQGGREKGSANLHEASGRAAEKAAAAVNVSPRLVADAVKVQREAAPEVVEAVKRGEVAVSLARRPALRRAALEAAQETGTVARVAPAGSGEAATDCNASGQKGGTP